MHCERLDHRSMPSNKDGFDGEYSELLLLDSQVLRNPDEFFAARLGSNAAKNRYPTAALPNESTRVRLRPLTKRGDGDYINANFIDAKKLFGAPFTYIACQAPLPSTVGDFWRMVEDTNVHYIVMLTALVEGGRVKSHRYWPATIHETEIYGTISVTLLSENIRPESTYRTMVMKSGPHERLVQHYCYTG